MTKRIYTVKSFEVGPWISPVRFTPRTISLPINTMIVDYRLKLEAGF